MKKVFEVETRATSSGIKLHIYKELCKGCEICVHFCPKEVLVIGPDLKVVVVNPDGCTGCMLCELRCPDFAIFVERPENRKGFAKSAEERGS